MISILKSLDWSPLYVTLRTGIWSIIFVFIFGLAAAVFVLRLPKKVRWIIDAILTVPLVLPPTVAGYLLLLLFSLRRPAGMFLKTSFGIKFVQTPAGCVLAASVIAFPLMYRSARAALEQADRDLLYAGRTLGMSEFSIIMRVIIPAASPGLISGGMLAFARAVGEYGATSMLAGNILGKTRTIALAIASEVSSGNYKTAGVWTFIITAAAFLIILSVNLITGIGTKRIGRT